MTYPTKKKKGGQHYQRLAAPYSGRGKVVAAGGGDKTKNSFLKYKK